MQPATIDPLFLAAAHDLTAPGRANLRRGVVRASRNLVPNPRVRTAAWIQDNIIIPNGSRPGPVVLEPVQEAICDAHDEEGVTHILWLKPPRSGSTTLTACLVIKKSAYDGQDSIVYERSDKDAQDFHDKKLRPFLEASTAIAHFLRPDSRSGIQDSWTDIYGTNGAAIQCRGVQSDSNFKAIRGELVDLQEVGDKAYGSGAGAEGEGSKLGQAETRGAEYPFPKFNLGGTPTTPRCLIVVEYEKSDKRLLMMTFPCCRGAPQPFHPRVSQAGTREEVKGAGLKFRCDAAGDVTEYGYECAHCGTWLREEQRNAVMAAGRFVASEPRPKRKGYAGFYTWGIHSKDPFFAWENIVAKYVAQRADPGQAQEFQNLYLAQPFVPVIEGKRDADNLESLCEDYGGVLPAGVLWIFAGMDTQRGSERHGQLPRHEIVWIGVGANGEKWILRRLVIERAPVEHVDDDGVVTQDWDRIDPFSPTAARLIWDALDAEFTKADGTRLRAARVGVDTGYETNLAMSFCAHEESRSRKVVPFKGRKETWGHFGKRAPAVTAGGVAVRRAQLQLLGTYGLKDHVELCLGLEPGAPSSFHYPIELQGTDFFEQLTAEHLESHDRDPDLTRWRKAKVDASNEVLDCVVLGLGAMHVQLARSSRTRKELGLDAQAGLARVALHGPRPKPEARPDDEGGEVAEQDPGTERAKAMVRAALKGVVTDKAAVREARDTVRTARLAEKSASANSPADMLRRLRAEGVGRGRADGRDGAPKRRTYRAAVPQF